MKKTKKIAFFALGGIVYLSLWYFLSGFGNKYSHPIINEQMLEAFTKDLNYQSLPKFKNVSFRFEESLIGTGISSGGKFSISETSMQLSVRDWIKKGGDWADEPEIFNSLRHFYDPTEASGSRYLKDQARGLLGYFQTIGYTNPQIDGVEWAVAHADHEYSWINGKIALKNAFNTADETKRNGLMAKAWRCFGETLHMLADNTTPAHVRNDAHPAPLGDSKYFGDPDTFEEYMDYLGQKDVTKFKNFASKKADASLITTLQSVKNIRSLAHETALYTNANFFSNQTIYGTDSQEQPVKHRIHADKTYTSPRINSKMFIGSYFEKDGIKLCTQPWWIGIVSNVGEVYIDYPTVESQATKIIPAAVEAGRNAFRLFIPEIRLNIQSFSKDGLVKGSVVHVTDEEYTLPIVYNGAVDILDKKLNRIATFQAKDGAFEGTLSNPNQEEISAYVAVGGIMFRSLPAISSDAKLVISDGDFFLNGDFEVSSQTKGFPKDTWIKINSFGDFFDPKTLKESNGTITGSFFHDTWIPFQVSFNPITFELTGLRYNAKTTFSNGDIEEESINIAPIPVKYFKKIDSQSSAYVTYYWEISGTDVMKYVTESKRHSIYKNGDEYWTNKMVAADRNSLVISIEFKKQ